MANFCLKSGDFFQKLIFGGAEVAILNENVAIFRIFHLATLKKTKLRREQAQNRYDIFKNRFGIKRKLVSHPFFVIIACACKKSVINLKLLKCQPSLLARKRGQFVACNSKKILKGQAPESLTKTL